MSENTKLQEYRIPEDPGGYLAVGMFMSRIKELEEENARLNEQLLNIAREIGELLPLEVQHRSAIDALRWFANEVARLQSKS